MNKRRTLWALLALSWDEQTRAMVTLVIEVSKTEAFVLR